MNRTPRPTGRTPKPTVAGHLAEADRIVQHVQEANALVGRLREGLANTRRTLEALLDYQHPKLTMSEPYHQGREGNSYPPARIIRAEIERIDLILGDRK